MIRAAIKTLGNLRWGLVALAFLCQQTSAAVPEYDVKAALLYKVSKFVHWPDGALPATGGTLHVCVIGHDDFGASIDALTGQKVQGQVIAIERLPNSPLAASACQIAFISHSERSRLASVLGALAGAPVLTVSDIEGFAGLGGMVAFATRDGKISFQINPAASARAGIEIGAQLLQLATLVSDSPANISP